MGVAGGGGASGLEGLGNTASGSFTGCCGLKSIGSNVGMSIIGTPILTVTGGAAGTDKTGAFTQTLPTPIVGISATRKAKQAQSY